MSWILASGSVSFMCSFWLSGRYVFLDGLQHKVETRHSLVLCLMMCPIGIISHVFTKVLLVTQYFIVLQGYDSS